MQLNKKCKENLAKVGSGYYRVKSKMVHMDLLLSIDEVSILLDENPGRLLQYHEAKTLPFPSVEVGKCLIFYIPASFLKTIGVVKELGVTKHLKFLKSMVKNRLTRLLDNNTDWSAYNLEDWK